MRVSRWGKSLAIRLPAALVEELGLKAGDEVIVRLAQDREFVVERAPSREALIARIQELARPLPPGFRVDRDEANAR